MDFKKLYYRTANCLTSDIIADMNPVSRVLGVDTSSGMGTVFTAMGTRFDIRFVAKEAFMATDSYEADTRSLDQVPVAEIMRYVRAQVAAENAVPEEYQAFVAAVRQGESVYQQYVPFAQGDENAPLLFLVSPAALDGRQTAADFAGLAERLGTPAYCTNQYGDCGYLMLQLGFEDKLDTLKARLAPEIGSRQTIVTDDAYVLDALLVLFPEAAAKILFIDEFLFIHKDQLQLGNKAGRVVAVHESGIIQRLYPARKVCYRQLFAGDDLVYPERSGYDVTDSGLAGGLGLAEPGVLRALAGRRMEDLARLKADLIITPCAAEALGLNCAEIAPVQTLLQFICGR